MRLFELVALPCFVTLVTACEYVANIDNLSAAGAQNDDDRTPARGGSGQGSGGAPTGGGTSGSSGVPNGGGSAGAAGTEGNATAGTSAAASSGAAGSGGVAGSTTTSGPASFIGTWHASGTQTLDCSGSKMTSTIDGSVAISAGKDSDLTVERSGCTVKLNVSGDRATYVAGQKCPVSVSGITGTISYDATSSVTLNGASAAKWFETAVAHFVSGGTSLDCTNTMDGQLTR